ncbi:MAG: Ribose import ATP-binding protein RbsA [Fimbriimonadaceae bacterium]|nr:Ribose import ATP-binding protein RbsA [Fimbriimonadaceae bacterium]
MSLAVEMRGVRKGFGSTCALDGVDLLVQPATAHAIVGENGAGKTTLMKILYGSYRPDGGTISVLGESASFLKPQDAIDRGIGMVSQHYSIIGELTCLENLILGAEGGAVLRTRELQDRAEGLARKMGFSFDWNQPASQLGPAGSQKLEILKLLWRDSKIMILDEPTAMLSPSDAEALFASLRDLLAEGRTILLVTHRLPEVMDFCHDVTVLRRGKLVASTATKETDARQLAEMIVGHTIAAPLPSPRQPSPVLLDVRSLTVRDHREHEAVQQATFQVEAGEVVGIAGVDGNGQRELVHGILGLVPAMGEISLAGERIETWTTKQRLLAGIRVIPEDRHDEAIVEDWSLTENAGLGLQMIEPIRQGSNLATGRLHEIAKRASELFETRFASLSQPIRGLSGGNQQRYVAGRALQLEPLLLLAFQPARGLDIDATQRLYETIRETCRRTGMGAILICFDIDELLTFADRILVLNCGRLSALPQGREFDRQEIGRMMVGAA